jgi:hypothetical protein
MKYEGFCGQSYTSGSKTIDAEKSFNLFPEVVNVPGTTPKARIVLRRKPGYNLLQTLPDSPGRGKFAINGRDFAVAGGSFFELLSATTSILRGSIPAGTSPVQMACNTVQVGLLADGLFYVFVLATNTFIPVIGQNGLPANPVSLTSIDTYFLLLGGNSNEFGLSGLLDGTTWSGLDFGSSQEPDNAVAIANLHLYFWIFGQQETIVFQDSSNSSFPFQRVPGSQIEQGCGSATSVCVADNTLFWLGSDARGPSVAYRADGFLPTRVSTHAVEEAWQGYSTTADCVTFPYQQGGHLFILWHFPTAGKTWGYDVAGGMWHERGFWDVTTSLHSAELGRFHSYCFGKHLVSDYRNGNIYEMSTAFASDAGAAIRWLRVAPPISSDDGDFLFFSWFELQLETGGGIPGGGIAQVMVRWSDDGGETWCEPRQVGMGAIGQTKARARTWRNGRGRDRVYEVSGTDAVPRLAIVGAAVGVDDDEDSI